MHLFCYIVITCIVIVTPCPLYASMNSPDWRHRDKLSGTLFEPWVFLAQSGLLFMLCASQLCVDNVYGAYGLNFYLMWILYFHSWAYAYASSFSVCL